MKVYNIKDMSHGWFMGDFEPAVYRNRGFEIGHHHHKAGTSPVRHRHNIIKEYNYMIKGRAIVSGIEMTTGAIFLYDPGDIADIQFLEDTDLIVIKVPSIPDDKELV